MARHKKTQAIINAAYEVLEDLNPMTVRQVYYRLVYKVFCGQVLENSESSYKSISNFLVDARKDGTIPWEWIEDRTRKPRPVPMWNGLSDFKQTVLEAYKRNVWETQPYYLEVWLEKDALSGIFEDVLVNYGITLNVGRGYDGWSSVHGAAERWEDGEGVTVLYFGDFDPSGEDMKRSLEERLRGEFNCCPEIIKISLTKEHVIQYNLPHDFAKKTDTRHAKFVEKYGDIAVELDAMTPDLLQGMLTESIEQRMDLDALHETREKQTKDLEQLEQLFREVA